jgi:hypothetical protein
MPPYRSRLRCFHVPKGSGPHLPTQEGSGAATCHMTPDPASLLGGAPVLPRAPQLRTLRLCSGGLWRYHVSRDPQRVVALKNNERFR